MWGNNASTEELLEWQIFRELTFLHVDLNQAFPMSPKECVYV